MGQKEETEKILIMLTFIIIVSVLAIAWVVSLIVGIVRSEIACRRIELYRENKDGTLTRIH